MQRLTFSLDLTAIELRGMSATLMGMAAQIERNLNEHDDNVIDLTDDVDNEYLGNFEGMEVWADTPLTSQQAMSLPAETLEKHTGRIITGTEMDNDNDVVVDVELDEEGLPWDARIHGESKLKLKRGNTWKLIKGIDKAFAETVKAELRAETVKATLRAVMAKPASTELPAGLETTETIVKPAGPAGPSGPSGPAATELPAGEVKYVTNDGEWTREQLLVALYTDEQIDALPIAGQTVATEITFPELMQLVTPALAANSITQEQVTAACVAQGIASLNLIAARPDLVPAVKVALFG